jgi:hypothetical protein
VEAADQRRHAAGRTHDGDRHIVKALTASDRPDRKARTLSEALRIMQRMKEDCHIDAGLFELFLASGVHLACGRRLLRPEQLDLADREHD